MSFISHSVRSPVRAQIDESLGIYHMCPVAVADSLRVSFFSLLDVHVSEEEKNHAASMNVIINQIIWYEFISSKGEHRKANDNQPGEIVAADKRCRFQWNSLFLLHRVCFVYYLFICSRMNDERPCA